MNSVVRRVSLSLVLAATCAFAQRDLGTITGTVADPQGGVLPNTKVTIVEDATGLRYEVSTNNSGIYVRSSLPAGMYTVTAEAAGFRRAAQQNVKLSGGDRVGVDLALEVGDLSQSVEVSASAPLLQKESVIVGAVLEQKMVAELPLGNQRTFTFLARLSPGVLPAEGGARDANGGGFSANGVSSSGQNNFLLNGVDNNVNNIDLINQTSFVIGPPPEAIGEMTILTNANSAEYGRAAGGVINVSVRSGTNQYHGNVWEIFQNESMNANRWENNLNNTARGVFSQNQYGAAAGGPIIKNRTFFFVDYQGTRLNSSGGAISGLGSAGFSTVPTTLERKGDFSEFLTTAQISGVSALNGQIFDPLSQAGSTSATLTRVPFAGNIIPANRLDPAALKIAQLWPATNQPYLNARGLAGPACTATAACYPQNDLYNVTLGTLRNQSIDAKIDHSFNQDSRLFGLLSWGNRHNINDPKLGPVLDGTGFSSYNENSLSRNAQLGYTRVWNPTTITETRLAFTRLVATRYQANRTSDVFKEYGIGGFDGNAQAVDNGGMFAISLGNYTAIGGGGFIPAIEYSNVWDFVQNVSVTKRTHSMKFGFEYKPVAFPFFQFSTPRGSMTFSNNDSSYPLTTSSANTLTGDGFASFLLGRINSGVIQTTNFMNSTRKTIAGYAQDDWKVTSKLTINLGLRYELPSPVGDKFNDHSNFSWQDFTLYIPNGKNMNNPLPSNLFQVLPQLKVSRGEVGPWLVPWDKFDFGPRVGFAYSLGTKMVIRAGFGMFYSGEENRGGCCSKGLNPPFNNSASFGRTANGVNIGTFDPNPAFPGGFSGGFPLSPYTYPASPSLRGFVNDFRNGMVQKWNLSVQREFKRRMSIEAGYTGNHQAHTLAQWDPNIALNSCGGPYKPALGTPECIALAGNSSLTSANQKIFPNLSAATQDYSFAFGNYDAGTLKFEKQMDSDGLMLIAAYTLSHTLVAGSTPLSNGGPTRTDPFSFSSGYGNASQDTRHNWTTGFAWDIPVGKGKKFGGNMGRIAEGAVGNWQMNGIWTFRPWGQPYSISSNQCVGIWSFCGVDLISGQNPNAQPAGGRNPDKWFNTAAVKSPVAGEYGACCQNILYSPPSRTMDLTLSKGYKIAEKYLVQFRAEALNLGNTPQFSAPTSTIQSANFGKITATKAGSERHLQFSLRLQF